MRICNGEDDHDGDGDNADKHDDDDGDCYDADDDIVEDDGNVNDDDDDHDDGADEPFAEHNEAEGVSNEAKNSHQWWKHPYDPKPGNDGNHHDEQIFTSYENNEEFSIQ